MTHEIENCVYSQDEGKGWHGLGQVIDPSIAKDPTAIAKLAGLNFRVEKRECFFKCSDGSYQAAPGKDVLVRTDTDKMLSVVSDTRYHVENRQPVDIVEAFRDQLEKEHLIMSHIASLRGGADIVACAMLPPDYDITVGKSDVVKSYVTLSTGYNGHGTRCTKGGLRVVCANTLSAAVKDAEQKGTIRTIRASTVLEIDSLPALIAQVYDLVDDERHLYNNMANVQMSNADVSRYFADVLEVNISDLGKYNANGKKIVSTKTENLLKSLAESYSNAPGAAIATGTVWGALNSVTYFGTHLKGVRDTYGDGEVSARVASNLNGDSLKLKMRALQLAASYIDKVAA